MPEARAVIARGIAFAACLAACDSSPPPPAFQIVARDLPSALLSTWGTTASDVYVVGGDAGAGPIVMHFDGASWVQLDTGVRGNLWWVHGFVDGPIYMGGDGGTILRYQDGAFTQMQTPVATETVFGIWGATPDDVWAVGGNVAGSGGGFAWRLEGDVWVPAFADMDSAIWKMYGRASNDAWMVGTNGKAIHWDGQALTTINTGAGESLFTVHANAERFVAVGGFGTGAIFENTGDGWANISPDAAPAFVGVHLTDDGGFAVGQFGAIYELSGDRWEPSAETALPETFHSAWVDPDNGVWLAGGDVVTFPLRRGVLMYRGPLQLEGSLQ
jgi:hypothetical protein